MVNHTKIEWTDLTLNPIVGCSRLCGEIDPLTGKKRVWCYAYYQAKRQKQRCQLCYEFKPHPHLERLGKLPRTPKKIFLGSMTDMFDPQIKHEWLDIIFQWVKTYPQHTFQILTKQPQNILKYQGIIPSNVWLGISLSKQHEWHRITTLKQVKRDYNVSVIFASLEPLLDYIDCDFSSLDWVIIGQMTGKKPIRLTSTVLKGQIKLLLQYNIPIFIKDNCGFADTSEWSLREFPERWSFLEDSKRKEILTKPSLLKKIQNIDEYLKTEC